MRATDCTQPLGNGVPLALGVDEADGVAYCDAEFDDVEDNVAVRVGVGKAAEADAPMDNVDVGEGVDDAMTDAHVPAGHDKQPPWISTAQQSR